MSKRNAIALLLVICGSLAILLLTGVVTSMMAGIVFAIGLVGLGVLSSGFRND